MGRYRPIGKYDPKRMWLQVRVGAATDCWPWTGRRNEHGFGVIGKSGRTVLTHRLVWELRRGPIPDGRWVLHRCDNPPCCNPGHLFLGTQVDNMQDALAKGRLDTTSGLAAARLLPMTGRVLSAEHRANSGAAIPEARGAISAGHRRRRAEIAEQRAEKARRRA